VAPAGKECSRYLSLDPGRGAQDVRRGPI